MARGRARRSRGRGGWGARLGGLLILTLAGVGIWIGAGLVDEEAGFLPRTLDVEPPETSVPAPGERIRVEVLNAGGVRGMAAAATAELRDRGFDVVYYGNAPGFGREASTVLHRAGREEAARAVAEALGIDEVRSEPDSTLLVEVTVLIGATWLRRGEREEVETDAAADRRRD